MSFTGRCTYFKLVVKCLDTSVSGHTLKLTSNDYHCEVNYNSISLQTINVSFIHSFNCPVFRCLVTIPYLTGDKIPDKIKNNSTPTGIRTRDPTSKSRKLTRFRPLGFGPTEINNKVEVAWQGCVTQLEITLFDFLSSPFP